MILIIINFSNDFLKLLDEANNVKFNLYPKILIFNIPLFRIFVQLIKTKSTNYDRK